ncbi:lipopolysaccharide kinase InaA family protein [Oceanihabitans sp. 2_MG-2023]|uniref:lipopolysaccharide kinase InaA family protein n=1 Tax=Oceanihabitans sp. 2_MG-2023 TaxID=3062661 RepID=UPI0026E3F9ED|nr:lipopolysaccharide kinase InaA family protein [Oceanihabitans sp. 2_MG-2023]MDO6598078.1 lipopolysaccharide kinase InaA family protein [Oceanihabitans sp. 2_MG-2023]
MKYEVKSNFSEFESVLKDYILNFDNQGDDYGNQKRNSLKLFQLNDLTINIKSFRVPNLVNQIVYRFFRKSKAERSFVYANKLLDLQIGTPHPIAYFELPSPLLFKKSYYVSEHLDYELTFRELSHNPDMPDHDKILRAFTRFTFMLHEKGIHFLDHSPGNTLIKKVGAEYQFYLVDLNRMEFKEMSFNERIHNFARLTMYKSIVETMSDEYAKVSGEDYNKVFNLMWKETEAFQEKFHRKRRLKKKLKFWKK